MRDGTRARAERVKVASALFTLTGLLIGTFTAAGSLPASAQTITVARLTTLVTVAAETEPSPYSRDYFVHWIDADGNGCDTRQEVLIAESKVKATVGAGCKIIAGKWYSAYDNLTFTNPSSLDIDHFVPLHEAWQSGAWAWTSAQRQAYANDLGFAGALIAVSAASNRSKSDSDPAGWLPSYKPFDCTYVENWVLDKYRWSLTVDPTEKAVLDSQLAKCPPATLTIPTVVAGIPAPGPTPEPSASATDGGLIPNVISASPNVNTASPKPITAGAFCASTLNGKTGMSSIGVVYTCKTSATDSRLRWRR